MRLADLKVHQKIAFSFAFLLLASTIVPALVSITMISRTLEQRVQKQVQSASEMISETDFAFNGVILERLKRITNADIVTYTASGQIIASTFGPEYSDFVKQIQASHIGSNILSARSKFESRDLQFKGVPYRIVYRPVQSRPDAIVAFVADVSDKANAEATIIRAMLLLVIVMIFTMFMATQVLARRISLPLLQLVDVTRSVAAGDLSKKATVGGGDEIGILAKSLNDMVDDLRNSKEKLVESEKLAVAGLMAARVAHDIRNPLSSIKMQVQLLQPRLMPGQGKMELVRGILAQVDRVELVVEGLLDLARPSEIVPVRTSLHRFLEEILQQLDAQMRHRKIALSTHFDPSVPDLLLDVNRLTHGILNVLFNAAESMSTGGNIHLSTQLEPGGYVRLEISDEGEGIDPRVAQRVFEPFVTTKREGVGLGLVNARSVVEGHGGAIELIARHGGGTTAIIRLPVDGETKHTGRAGRKHLHG